MWAEYVAVRPEHSGDDPPSEWFGDGAGRPRAVIRTVELRLGPDRMETVFERFRVVWPPQHADAAADGA